MAELVQSVLRAYQVLRVFGPNTGPLTVREIAVRSGIPRSTCHSLCATLAHVSMLEALPGGGYQLGSAQAWLGAQAFERMGLVEATRAQVDQLQRAGYACVSVSQYVPRGWIVVLYRTGDATAHRVGGLGTRSPAYTCVEGQVVLASMSAAECDDILCPADATRLAADEAPEHARAGLAVLLARAREQGYLVSDQAGPQTRTIACPIRGWSGTGVGALSVTVNAQSLTRKKLADAAERLCEAAAAVSPRGTGLG